MTCNCEFCQKQQAYTTLEDFRKSTCVDPLIFWGWGHPSIRAKVKGVCTSIVRQSSSSVGCDNGVLGRDDILNAIRLAEQTYRDYVGDVVPTWHQELIDADKPSCHHKRLHGHVKIAVPSRNIKETGAPTYTALATVTLNTEYTISANYGTLPDTFKIVVPGLTSVDTSKVGVYVPIGQRTKDISNLRRWLIPHDYIDFTAGTLTIKGKAYLLALPELYETTQAFSAGQSAFNDYSLDPTNMANYLQTLEIGQIGVDACKNTAIRKNRCGCPLCSPAAPTCEYCTDVCLCVDDSRAGILRLADCQQPCRLPDKYCVNYLALGQSCDRDWTRDIGILAIAYLCAPVCNCSYSCLEQWYRDFANEDSKKRTTLTNLENPIGTRSGHMHAWNLIKKFRVNSGLAW